MNVPQHGWQLVDELRTKVGAARRWGLIPVDLAVARSMGISHQNIFFDKKIPEVRFPA